MDYYLFEVDHYSEYETDIRDNELYLTCTGWIIAGCNWSYKNMDYDRTIQIAHINNINCADDLVEAIERYNKRVERKLQVA
jgi:hypothetical protein